MIQSYQDLLVQVTRLLDGEETSASEIPYQTLVQVVNLGERRIYRQVRSRHNEKAFSGVTVTNNLAPIPDDWEATSVVHFGGAALVPKPEDWLREYLQNSRSGECLYFAEAGPSFEFGPAVTDGTVLQGRYFCRLPDLSSDTFAGNALIQAEPDLFLYAALAESAEFFPVGNRLAVWEAKYAGIRDAINTAKDRAAFSAGRIQRTTSTRLIG